MCTAAVLASFGNFMTLPIDHERGVYYLKGVR